MYATECRAHDISPVGIIVVAADERDRCNASQRIEHVIAADVASVNDGVDVRKDVRDSRMYDTVRVADDADAHGTVIPSSALRAPSPPRGEGQCLYLAPH